MRLFTVLSLVLFAAIVAMSAEAPVTLTPVTDLSTLTATVQAKHAVFLPAGAYTVPASLTLDGCDEAMIVGAGRIVGSGGVGTGTCLNFAPNSGLRIRNCRKLTLCNLSFNAHLSSAENAAIEILGDTPCTITLLNCTITCGLINGPAAHSGPGVWVHAPAKLLLQEVHVFHADPGLLLDHTRAEVTVLGGNYQSSTVHVRQRAGVVRMYGVGMQSAVGGADIELQAASPAPNIFAGLRSSGPDYFVRTPDHTAEKIDAVIKSCGGMVDKPNHKFVRYGAAGRLVLIGNNLHDNQGMIDARTATGTVWSLGNCFVNTAGDPYQFGPEVTGYAAGDLLGVSDLANELITAQQYAAAGYAAHAKLQFLDEKAPLPAFATDPEVTPVYMPLIANLDKLIPSVKQYGAVGDGKADDSAALQKAIDANQNGPLYFPAGAYRLTKPLFIDHRGGGWLVGAGKEQSLLTNSAGGSVLQTDGCGFACFQDLGFTLPAGAQAPVFDLNWDNNHAQPAGWGAALQANTLHRCRFSGGTYGLSIGAAGGMGSESLILGCEFRNCGSGVAVRNFNALTNNVVDCLFQGNGVALNQDTAGSFNLLNSRLEGSTTADIFLRVAVGDTFYTLNTTTTSPVLLFNGYTSARITVLFDRIRNLGQTATKLVDYEAASSLTFLGGELGAATLSINSPNGENSALLLGTHSTAPKPFLLWGKAHGMIFPAAVEGK